MRPTYSIWMLKHASETILKAEHPALKGQTFKRLSFHTLADGSRAVLRDVSSGQDYEMIVKPINRRKIR